MMRFQIAEDDYKLEMTGSLYSKIGVSTHKYLGTFANTDKALAFVRERMETEKFWPNVWFINDHGNVDLMDPVTGKFLDNSGSECAECGSEEVEEVGQMCEHEVHLVCQSCGLWMDSEGEEIECEG